VLIRPRSARTAASSGGCCASSPSSTPDNQAFRYDERRDGTPTLDGVKYLDIGLFHEAMLGVANYLEAIDTAVDHDQDLKNDALQMA